ncbi:type IV pilus modification protein PilV [Cupriavidus sp. USMAHM13]|uniref:type IV pilus modification PilV family protein n=1 Tax=Cupriavidus sp. USMAHM13 TaxID=1389192 RepID=UPI0008A6F740|nr:prepilin-type N-terminal cleavage/methylation domain-containing protein [Cupriavidus sp. USMAHM13]AOY98756.1 type IV pilus modification protein PilV [Cupriavidus sp. USMAHM13]
MRAIPSHRGRPRPGRPARGFALIEILVSVVILLVALLGAAGLLARSNQMEMETYQRVQALTLLQDMAARLNANRQVAPCYAAGSPMTVLGSGSTSVPACALGNAAQQALTTADLTAWNTALLGSAETSGGKSLGAMIGALGCIESVDPVNQVYRISVAWQGLAKTVAPALPCGSGSFGDDTTRRVVSIQVRIATLS